MRESAAIILAGGKNTRISRNKAFIQLPTGESILQNILNVLQKIFPEIIIVTNHRQAYLKFGVPVVEDLIKESGPLGGIFTGLCFSASKRSFVVACDMPFIKPALITLLLRESTNWDLVIPEVSGKVEPLFAVYSKDCIPVMFEHLKEQNLKMRDILDRLRAKRIGVDQINRLDPQHLSFFNINTEEDLKRAESLKIKMGQENE
jgi:molybdopterin-guanine dinucleotide biosynthesis protein A